MAEQQHHHVLESSRSFSESIGMIFLFHWDEIFEGRRKKAAPIVTGAAFAGMRVALNLFAYPVAFADIPETEQEKYQSVNVL